KIRNRLRRIKSKLLCEINEFHHVIAALATFEPGDERLIFANPSRKLSLRQARRRSLCDEKMDAGDDAPVVVEVGAATPPRWRRCAHRFICGLKCQVLDRTLWQSSWFFAQADPLSPEVLSRLRRCFEEGPQTYGWPGNTNYRFYNARSRLLLCDGDEQCDWSIQLASAELAAASRNRGNCGDRGQLICAAGPA